MPQPSLFACPECRLTRVVETNRTHPSPPIIPTVENPAPADPHSERERECLWCHGLFITTEKVTKILRKGDPERVQQAITGATDEKADVPVEVKLILNGDKKSVSIAHSILKAGVDPRVDTDQMLLFEEIEHGE